MYRIIPEPSWQVQKQHNGEWVTIYYCKDEVAANRCKEKCERKAKRWEAMTPEQRMRAILR